MYLYAFLDTREVHALPMPKTREWFLPRAKSFPLKHVQTRTGAIAYTTVGAIVPVRELLAEVPEAVRLKVGLDGELLPMRRPAQVRSEG